MQKTHIMCSIHPFIQELPVRKSSIPSNEHVVQWQRQRQGWMGNVALVWQKAQRAAGFQRKEVGNWAAVIGFDVSSEKGRLSPCFATSINFVA